MPAEAMDVALQTSPHDLGLGTTGEARRQIEVCNACRYCEGFCAVFPAITQQKVFTDGDVTQLANLCHNCRGCFYSCQYTAPHEFALNLPKALAEERAESWERFAWPGVFGGLFQRHGVAVAAALIAALAAMFAVVSAARPAGGDGFYAYLSHAGMVAIFAPAFLLPVLAIAIGLRRYWAHVGGAPVTWRALVDAFGSAGRMKNLAGGQGQGCNFEKGDRYSNARRHCHQSVMYGFLLCFASTSSATLLHYVFGLEAPYDFISLPKLLGVPGGLLLVAGGIGLAVLKTRADPALSAARLWGGEMAFVLLLVATGLTGLLLYAATGTAAVPALLAVHLGAVLTLFLLAPYSKMVHGFYRLAALTRDAQLRQTR
ncbi:tricarballylate utilization 4Fe-4S protein TcuB [Acuticoccus sp. MNP-M23]|uniref:tricarballylate utilization 4Fe-4S protein TcuB n=1 Tax=Acuticoccus sp. MNP-M23 TaxID=3072793 RepID=UPI002814CAB1|nr:tricarballylate utilization 4Fe-4S protein TcuB [Acuticoccus sp. MNP-M23]WMS44453.1 tricarballylate utilization 4Fe-4S protein TcuB [Acuticoccus sp. MNP-M23]